MRQHVKKLTLRVLDPISAALAILLSGLAVQHLEGAIKQSVDLLQTTGFVGVGGTNLADVAGAALHRVILDGSVTDLKDLDGQ